jgi:hypothetical protein
LSVLSFRRWAPTGSEGGGKALTLDNRLLLPGHLPTRPLQALLCRARV